MEAGSSGGSLCFSLVLLLVVLCALTGCRCGHSSCRAWRMFSLFKSGVTSAASEEQLLFFSGLVLSCSSCGEIMGLLRHCIAHQKSNF